MNCVAEAEDPRKKPCQAGIRPRTGVEVVGERTGRMVERRRSAHAACVQ